MCIFVLMEAVSWQKKLGIWERTDATSNLPLLIWKKKNENLSAQICTQQSCWKVSSKVYTAAVCPDFNSESVHRATISLISLHVFLAHPLSSFSITLSQVFYTFLAIPILPHNGQMELYPGQCFLKSWNINVFFSFRIVCEEHFALFLPQIQYIKYYSIKPKPKLNF